MKPEARTDKPAERADVRNARLSTGATKPQLQVVETVETRLESSERVGHNHTQCWGVDCTIAETTPQLNVVETCGASATHKTVEIKSNRHESLEKSTTIG
ncbi:MAG: hypothetical protein JNK05_11840 [Myxococcales bacterium]|nr:hypothetical protein [Myxococcales bacterium]